ncbi:hypothetical protein CEXT_78281 [Caerostris extrusa]|uniref:Uncharacterized protein n=1 Tax=Caerostris extrusa TaxID=172846 RepID=A0AAV4QJB8_CAEEX|nr:hypothetical protein CEXT_78281 [Caerostris extrusa]
MSDFCRFLEIFDQGAGISGTMGRSVPLQADCCGKVHRKKCCPQTFTISRFPRRRKGTFFLQVSHNILAERKSYDEQPDSLCKDIVRSLKKNVSLSPPNEARIVKKGIINSRTLCKDITRPLKKNVSFSLSSEARDRKVWGQHFSRYTFSQQSACDGTERRTTGTVPAIPAPDQISREIGKVIQREKMENETLSFKMEGISFLRLRGGEKELFLFHSYRMDK